MSLVKGMSEEEFWNNAFSKINDKVGESVFELWFKPMKLHHLKDKTVFIDIPNRFFKDWVEDSYPNLINEAIEGELGYPVSVKLRVAANEDGVLKKIDSRNESRRNKLASKGIYLNPKYTFDAFVVGPSISLFTLPQKGYARVPEVYIIHCSYMAGLDWGKPI